MMKARQPWAYIVSIYNLGNEISGGDKILIYLIRYLSENYRVRVFCSPEVISFIENESNFSELDIVIVGSRYPAEFEVSIGRLALHMHSRYLAFKAAINHFTEIDSPRLIYSASDFLPDILAGVFLKKKFKAAKFAAGYYLFAPNPFSAKSPYKGLRRLRGLTYWIMQLLTIKIAKKYADYLFVTSPDEKLTALSRWNNLPNKIGVLYGGIPVEEIKQYLDQLNCLPPKPLIKYDGVFVGRLHYQKGVINLIDIWKKVVDILPMSKLAIIGDGPLSQELISKIDQTGLQNNVDHLGYKDGLDKWKIYTQSKIALHPATFDSGGMAAAEGLAFGLPGLAFDLPSLREYYARGVIKAKCFSNDDFAEKIIGLLKNSELYNAMSSEAQTYAFTEWHWRNRLDNASIEISGQIGMIL
jgi:glycosyltransferase involved in cell wall biosynthesis